MESRQHLIAFCGQQPADDQPPAGADGHRAATRRPDQQGAGQVGGDDVGSGAGISCLQLGKVRHLERHTGRPADSAPGSRARPESRPDRCRCRPPAPRRAAPRRSPGPPSRCRRRAPIGLPGHPLQRHQAQPRRRMVAGAEAHRGWMTIERGSELGTRGSDGKTEVTARRDDRDAADGDRLQVLLRPPSPVFVVDLGGCDDSVGNAAASACAQHRRGAGGSRKRS